MEHNPLIPVDGEHRQPHTRSHQVTLQAGERETISPYSYPRKYGEPRSASAGIATRVRVGLVRGLGLLLTAIFLWLRLPLLWLLGLVARLSAIGAGASLLFWWLSARPDPIIATTGLIALAINFAWYLLLWRYDGFLMRLESSRF